MRYESGVATGSLPVVYTLQFDHTLPYLFQIKNFFWQIGVDAFFAYLVLFCVLLKSIKKNKALLIFLVFPLFYFLYVGSWHTKFVRYMVPLIPFLLIASSFFSAKNQIEIQIIGEWSDCDYRPEYHRLGDCLFLNLHKTANQNYRITVDIFRHSLWFKNSQ